MEEAPGFRSDLRHAIKLHKHASCQKGSCAYCSSGSMGSPTVAGKLHANDESGASRSGHMRKHSSSGSSGRSAASLLGVTRYEVQKTEIALEASSKKSNLTICVTPSGPTLEGNLDEEDDLNISPRWWHQKQQEEQLQQLHHKQPDQDDLQTRKSPSSSIWDDLDRDLEHDIGIDLEDRLPMSSRHVTQPEAVKRSSSPTLAASLPMLFAAALSPLSLGQRSASSSISSLGSVEEQKLPEAMQRSLAAAAGSPFLRHASVSGSLHNPATCTNIACAYCVRR